MWTYLATAERERLAVHLGWGHAESARQVGRFCRDAERHPDLVLAGTLAEVLHQRNLVLLLLLMAAVVGGGLKWRPGQHEVWVALGVTAVFGMALLRLGGSPDAGVGWSTLESLNHVTMLNL